MNYACDMPSICVATPVDQGITPCQVWYGFDPSFEDLFPFGTVGYMKNTAPGQKLAPRGPKCVLVGTFSNHPRNTFRTHNLARGSMVLSQEIR